jgi:hypothetical protein
MSENGKVFYKESLEIREEGEIASESRIKIISHPSKKSSNSPIRNSSRRSNKKSREEKNSHRKYSSSSRYKSNSRQHQSRKQRSYKSYRSRSRSRHRENKKSSKSSINHQKNSDDVNKIHQTINTANSYTLRLEPDISKEENQTHKPLYTLTEDAEEIFVTNQHHLQEDLKNRREERQKRISLIKQISVTQVEEESPSPAKKDELSDIKYSMTQEDRTKLLHLLAEEREKAMIATSAPIGILY